MRLITLITTLFLFNICFAKSEIDNNLMLLSINDLMDMDVTLASRNEEKQFVSSSAISVITQEDIRRTGLTSIPELLRTVPGMHVGKIDANKWAINARGANDLLSGDMLVLIDGRTVYTPLFSGVYWDMQDTLIDNIDRIEIIRGPGATLWGTNAVNGIINIVKKNAGETQGGLINAGIGDEETLHNIDVRYGFKTTHFDMRYYLKSRKLDDSTHLGKPYTTALGSNNNSLFNEGDPAFDELRSNQAGFRMDGQLNEESQWTLQADIAEGHYHDLRYSSSSKTAAKNFGDTQTAHILTKWIHHLQSNDTLSLQFYFDRFKREDHIFIDNHDTYDAELQHSIQFKNHQIVWGLGYRYISDDTALPITDSTIPASLNLQPPSKDYETFSAFFQDKIEILTDKLALTLGSKFERDEFSGHSYQPTAKLIWMPGDKHAFWTAISRAVRTPSRLDKDGALTANFVCFAFTNEFSKGIKGEDCTFPIGDPNASSVIVQSREIGFRAIINNKLLYDMTLFHNKKRNDNESFINQKFYGGEIDIKYEVSETWKLALAYTSHRGEDYDQNNNKTITRGIPQQNAHLRSYWDISDDFELDTMIYYVDDMKGGLNIPDYTRLDIRLGWHPSSQIQLSLLLMNLLDKSHPENFESNKVNTGSERSAFLNAKYYF